MRRRSCQRTLAVTRSSIANAPLTDRVPSPDPLSSSRYCSSLFFRRFFPSSGLLMCQPISQNQKVATERQRPILQVSTTHFVDDDSTVARRGDVTTASAPLDIAVRLDTVMRSLRLRLSRPSVPARLDTVDNVSTFILRLCLRPSVPARLDTVDNVSTFILRLCLRPSVPARTYRHSFFVFDHHDPYASRGRVFTTCSVTANDLHASAAAEISAGPSFGPAQDSQHFRDHAADEDASSDDLSSVSRENLPSGQSFSGFSGFSSQYTVHRRPDGGFRLIAVRSRPISYIDFDRDSRQRGVSAGAGVGTSSASGSTDETRRLSGDSASGGALGALGDARASSAGNLYRSHQHLSDSPDTPSAFPTPASRGNLGLRSSPALFDGDDGNLGHDHHLGRDSSHSSLSSLSSLSNLSHLSSLSNDTLLNDSLVFRTPSSSLPSSRTPSPIIRSIPSESTRSTHTRSIGNSSDPLNSDPHVHSHRSHQHHSRRVHDLNQGDSQPHEQHHAHHRSHHSHHHPRHSNQSFLNPELDPRSLDQEGRLSTQELQQATSPLTNPEHRDHALLANPDNSATSSSTRDGADGRLAGELEVSRRIRSW